MRRWTLPGGCSTSISVSANACQQLIGVAAKEADLPWVAEFFELFKTPWELAVGGKHYRVLLSADDQADTVDADLALVYGTKELSIDRFTAARRVSAAWRIVASCSPGPQPSIIGRRRERRSSIGSDTTCSKKCPIC